MSEDTTLTLGLVGVIFAVVVAAFAIWWRIESLIKTSVQRAIDQAERYRAENSNNLLVVNGQIQLIMSQLQDHRIFVLDNFVKRESMKEFREEILRSLTELKGSVGAVHGRFDRLVEHELITERERNREGK